MGNSDVFGFGPRFYRDTMGGDRFKSFVVSYKDSDLWIGVDPGSYSNLMVEFAREKLIALRSSLEEFIFHFPLFAQSFSPVKVDDSAPDIAVQMSKAGFSAGTGPMAAVAGAFAEFIGKEIQQAFSVEEIVVENGGDIYMKLKSDMVLAVYAGKSPLSGKIGLAIPAGFSPIGICTSAGKVGPSVSFGKADAVVVACKDTALADAYATELGNRVKGAGDVASVIEGARTHPDILSLLIICDDKLGVLGQFSLLPLG